MAIAFDNATSAAAGAGPSSLTYSHTVGVGLSNSIIVVGVIYYDATATVTGITYNGAALTKILRESNGVNQSASELWYRLAPSSGANNVIVTMSATPSGAGMASGAVSLSGVNQGAPEANTGSIATGTHTTHSVNITTIAANAWLVDCMCWRSAGSDPATFVPNGSQVSRTTVNNTLADSLGMSTLPVTSPGSTADGWTFTSTGTATALAVASFAPAAVTGSLFLPPSLTGLGSGGPFFHNPLN